MHFPAVYQVVQYIFRENNNQVLMLVFFFPDPGIEAMAFG